ncbi:MAG: hypothetical protein C0404_10700 [Verrucomicrobia bacterium]|nr:hypothetical protein [Verrucomicrobiota bacterium]
MKGAKKQDQDSVDYRNTRMIGERRYSAMPGKSLGITDVAVDLIAGGQIAVLHADYPEHTGKRDD